MSAGACSHCSLMSVVPRLACRGKRAKKAGGAAPAALPAWRHSELAAVPEAAEPESGEECGPQAQERRPDSPPGTGLVHRRVGQQGGDASDLSSGLEAGDGKDAWLAAADNGAAAEEEEEEEEEGGAGEGGELSDFGTPSTPVGEEGEAVAALQAQVQHLIADLQAAQERCVVLEAEVREEVAEEMAQVRLLGRQGRLTPKEMCVPSRALPDEQQGHQLCGSVAPWHCN